MPQSAGWGRRAGTCWFGAAKQGGRWDHLRTDRIGSENGSDPVSPCLDFRVEAEAGIGSLGRLSSSAHRSSCHPSDQVVPARTTPNSSAARCAVACDYVVAPKTDVPRRSSQEQCELPQNVGTRSATIASGGSWLWSVCLYQRTIRVVDSNVRKVNASNPRAGHKKAKVPHEGIA